MTLQVQVVGPAAMVLFKNKCVPAANPVCQGKFEGSDPSTPPGTEHSPLIQFIAAL